MQHGEAYLVPRAMGRCVEHVVFNKTGQGPGGAARCGRPQRVAVACVTLDRRQHLSAEQALDRLKRRGTRVSKATVYNTCSPRTGSCAS